MADRAGPRRTCIVAAGTTGLEPLYECAAAHPPILLVSELVRTEHGLNSRPLLARLVDLASARVMSAFGGCRFECFPNQQRINSCSEPCLRSRWALASSIREVPSSSERAASIAPNAEKFDNQKPRAASFLFVRRGAQSYDEFIAAVSLLASPEHDAQDDQHVRHFLDWRKRKCVYLVWSQVA
jgi:hypothetical protein